MTTPRPSEERARWAPFAVLALTVVAAGWRFPWLTAQDLWFDEVFSVVLASQDVGELLRRAIADQTNPPGFYLLLWGWMRIGNVGEAWVRALPAVAGTLTVPAVVALARTLGLTWRSALLGGLLAAVSPLLVTMSLEVRAYAPLALLVAISLALGARMATREDTGRRRGRTALAVTDAALVMLHYFGALAVLARIVAAFVTAHRGPAGSRARVRRDAVVTAIPAALLLAAWFAMVLLAVRTGRVAGNAAWIPAPGAADLLGFGSLVVGTLDLPGGAAVVAGLLLAAIIAARRLEAAPWLLSSALLPLAIVYAVSALTGRSLWVGRYLVVVLPAFVLLVAALPETISAALPAPWRLAPWTLIASWAVAAGVLAAAERPEKPRWSRIVPALAAGSRTVVCVNELFVGLPLQYHAIRAGVRLEVREMPQCAAARESGWVMMRPGTDVSLGALQGAGARLGPPRSLDTTLPPLTLRRMGWPAP
ncbi:MAG: glycosyltransferase family 39 protein [Gemmatimonadota bacterium]|nr:glycosyltransferase family 39 protein [Gemmatimonadota bacterium]